MTLPFRASPSTLPSRSRSRTATGLRGAAMFSLAALCQGCLSPERLGAILDDARQTQSRNAERRAAFMRTMTDPHARQAAQDVGKPWLAGRPQPLARDVTLPPALRRNVDTTLMFAGGQADLPTLAERITRATGIGVRVRPDALLPLENFLPRLSGSVGSGVAAPLRAALPGGPQPLARVLDILSWRLGVHWRYADGAIEFYRTETRVFEVRALTLNASTDARLGRRGNPGKEGFDNTSNTVFSSGEQNAMAAIRSRIEAFLTRAGTVTAAPGTAGSVVVTDTRDALERVAKFVDRENKALTRRVRLVFEEITVVAKDRVHGGIDWNVLYQSARAAAATAMAANVDVAGGVASATMGSSPFAGTKAMISALSEIGTVVRHSSVPVLTLNRRPVTHAVRTTFSYVDQIQGLATGLSSNAATQAALPTVSVSQKQETVGSFLTLVPDAQEDGQILLSIAYDNTVAQPLKSLTFGKSDNSLEVQQITIDGSGTVQQVELRAGQPMIISGFDRREDEYDRRRVTPQAPMILGGDDRAARRHATTVIIVTAQVEEGF